MSTIIKAYQVRPDADEWEEVEVVHQLDGGQYRVRRGPGKPTFIVAAKRLGSLDNPSLARAVNRTKRKEAARLANGRGVLRTRRAEHIREGDVIIGRVGMPRLPVDFTVETRKVEPFTGSILFTTDVTGVAPIYISPGAVFVVEVHS